MRTLRIGFICLLACAALPASAAAYDFGALPLSGHAKQIALGRGNACAVSMRDRLICWGVNPPALGKPLTPSAAVMGSAISKVAMGDGATCALLASTSRLSCWGNRPGKLAPGSLGQVSDMAILQNGSAGCALLLDNAANRKKFPASNVKCWGSPLPAIPAAAGWSSSISTSTVLGDSPGKGKPMFCAVVNQSAGKQSVPVCWDPVSGAVHNPYGSAFTSIAWEAHPDATLGVDLGISRVSGNCLIFSDLTGSNLPNVWDQELACWNVSSGNEADGTSDAPITSQDDNNHISSLSVSSLASGQEIVSACVINTNNLINCWGEHSDRYGQMDGGPAGVHDAVVSTNVTNKRQISISKVQLADQVPAYGWRVAYWESQAVRDNKECTPSSSDNWQRINGSEALNSYTVPKTMHSVCVRPILEFYNSNIQLPDGSLRAGSQRPKFYVVKRGPFP